MIDPAARAADVARASYGRLLAILASRNSDIALAEDALSEAFRLALVTWPETGVPNNPEAWLITTARHRTIDEQRRTARSPVISTEDYPDVIDIIEDAEAIPDNRLALMFVCAHPAIEQSMHTPLMLQTVLGFESADIGRSFLVSPAALQQRLVRAKRKIRDAKIAFAIPERNEMPGRIDSVMEAIYGAYALDWMNDPDARDMTGEALYLAKLLAELLPGEAEALGLAALIGFIHARSAARLHDGKFVPLNEQDTKLWNSALIADANSHLAAASGLKHLGRFQLEAAIQQVHIKRVDTGITDWKAIFFLSEGLCRLWPTLGAEVDRAAAICEVGDPEFAFAELARLDLAYPGPFQPREALRAHCLAKLGKTAEASAAYAKAISLTTEPAVREWLKARSQ